MFAFLRAVTKFCFNVATTPIKGGLVWMNHVTILNNNQNIELTIDKHNFNITIIGLCIYIIN